MRTTEELRQELRRITSPTPKKSFRQVSKESGVSLSTLWRFASGKQVRSDVVDKVAAYLDNGGENAY